MPPAQEWHWSEAAACRGTALDEFFPEGRGAAVQAEVAKSFCQRCAVREPCLAEALQRSERHGVWGGLDEDERRVLQRRRRDRAARRAAAEEGAGGPAKSAAFPAT